MGLFNSKKEEKVGLPALPDFPDLPEASEDSHFSSNEFLSEPKKLNIEVNPLRNLPVLERAKFSPEEIKSAVNPSERNMQVQGMPKQRFEPEIRNMQVQGMQKSNFEKFLPPLHSQPKEVMKIREMENEIMEQEPRESFRKKEEPVFIRLDKVQMAVRALEDIKNKIIDIEKALNKTKEIKRQEEIEIEDWRREVHAMKSRLETIDKEIFSGLD
jgi:hypothetical protein